MAATASRGGLAALNPMDQKASSQGDAVFFCFPKFEDESSFVSTKKATPEE